MHVCVTADNELGDFRASSIVEILAKLIPCRLGTVAGGFGWDFEQAEPGHFALSPATNLAAAKVLMNEPGYIADAIGKSRRTTSIG